MGPRNVGTIGARSVRALTAAALIAAAILQSPPAFAASVSVAAFTGGAGTAVVGGTLYARSGGALTLSLTTSSDTKCVQVSGAHTAEQRSSTAKSSWTFAFSAGSGDGVQTITATARPDFNQNNCTGQPGTRQASYVLDNTGPVVTGALAPLPNANGWNRANVTIAWTATDAGSGVASGPTPAGDTVTVDTPGVTRTSTATDRLGNAATGSITVKLDRTSPVIAGSRTPAANANGWNNGPVTVSFSCSDALSGIASCPGSTLLSNDGAAQSVAGTATDTAGNSAGATVGGISIDRTAPQLSGSPTTSANANGWYRGDVIIDWTCSDALSGIAGACPADGLITGDGSGLTASSSVADRAGNVVSATSSPSVRIDGTAPVTTAAAPTGWSNGGVTVTLSATDALSGVSATRYALDGGAVQTGTTASIEAEGVHSLEFWSMDAAGNEEPHRTVQVRIDRTAPSISHVLSPDANDNGWHSGDVTVEFTCADAASGLASCTDAQTVSTEGAGQVVTGTAVDHAGNDATDDATVSIDLTDPTISGATDRAPNGAGWFAAPVTVSFTCEDLLSGVDLCQEAETISTEGEDQAVTGTATDAAGNGASTTVGDIDIDRTDPTLSGDASPLPNAHGWYRADVAVSWTCGDTLSGIDGACPADALVIGEGDALSATAHVADRAGNTRTRTVSGIRIDRTAPSTTAHVADPLETGWYAGPVEVTLATGPDLSGIDVTYYQVDDGSPRRYDGPFEHDLTGEHTITFWSEDLASNVEDRSAPGHSITLKIDGNPPTITGSREPAANGFGWNNTPVTVGFLCEDLESGIAACSDPALVANEGEDQTVTGTALDNAGNHASLTVDDIDIDVTAPTVSGAPTSHPNAFGWYRDDVTIVWSAQDGLSGVDVSTLPADTVVTGEGFGLVAGPVSAFDRAGNEGSGSVADIHIDRTAPGIAAATVNDDLTPRAPNGAGWFNSAVRVHYTCDDLLSGVQECADDDVLSSDGAGQQVSGAASDRADNLAGTTLTGIDIDSQAPTTTAALSCTGANDYCNDDASVELSAADQPGLSGVREVRFRIGSGDWQTVSGSAATVDVPLNGSGEATVRFYAVDAAGNEGSVNAVQIDYDTIAPTVSHVLTPSPNAAGWNRSDVTVHFDAIDDPDGSGVDASTVTGDVVVTDETAGRIVRGEAYDLAGNRGSDSVEVKLDETAPSIAGAATTTPNGHGWYAGPVTVHFTCSDALSGIAICPTDSVLSYEGAGQSRTGSALDAAGNGSSATVGGINIDTTDPSIVMHGVADGGVYTLGAVPGASCSATDAGSGVDGTCRLTVTGGLANGVGTYSFAATATDHAGNATSVTGSYRVVYSFTGFLQPINDTAHQVGTGVSIFKAGSTVPVKFRLRTADGRVVQATMAPVWLAPAPGSALTAPVDESVYASAPMSGGAYRWDATDQQYIYTWGTPKTQANRFWRIGVTLDDGTTHFVNIGLR